MKTLGEATDTLLASDAPAQTLTLADAYIRQYLQNPKVFILPRDHAHVAPFVQTFAYDMEKWVTFVKAVRDEMLEVEGRRGERYLDMHKLFRTLEVRRVQQVRRERVRQAVAWLEAERSDLTADQKKLWVRRLEQLWLKQRRAWLDAHRKQRGKRLTLEEQHEVLDEFWADVDENIRQGNLPKYE